jgi:PAS domain S-box-containing protein
MAVGIPKAAAFAPVNFIFVRNLLVFGVMALLAIAAAWWFGRRFILRPVEALLQATKRLQAGDLEARTELPSGQSELNQLAGAFDQMAGRLQSREQQLRRSLVETTELKNLLDSVFDSIVSGVLTTDLQGGVTLCNTAALRILGYRDIADLTGRNIADLWPPLGALLLPALYRVGHDDEPVIGLETSLEIPPKGLVHLRFNLSSLKGHEQTQGVAIVVDDVTEKRQMDTAALDRSVHAQSRGGAIPRPRRATGTRASARNRLRFGPELALLW